MNIAKAVSRAVPHEWGRRVEAEYASAAITAELQHWLIQLGVSPDTLEDCHRIVADELAHAELSREVFLAAGGHEAAITIDGSRLRIPHSPKAPLFERTLQVCADFYCCGETVARPLFREMLRGASHDIVKKALTRILKDEARHSAFGWALLEELLERASDAQKKHLSTRVTGFMKRISDGYGGEVEKPSSAISVEESEWGLLSLEEYSRLSQGALQELILPRFVKLGVA